MMTIFYSVSGPHINSSVNNTLNHSCWIADAELFMFLLSCQKMRLTQTSVLLSLFVFRSLHVRINIRLSEIPLEPESKILEQLKTWIFMSCIITEFSGRVTMDGCGTKTEKIDNEKCWDPLKAGANQIRRRDSCTGNICRVPPKHTNWQLAVFEAFHT